MSFNRCRMPAAIAFSFLILTGVVVARPSIDTSGFDGTYDVGDVIGGIRVGRVIHMNNSNLPGLQPGRDATNGGTLQNEWDVYVLDSDISVTPVAWQSVIEFQRNDVGSVAPRLVIIDLLDHTLTIDDDSGIAHGTPIRLTAVGGGPGTPGGVTDSVIIKNGTIIHNLNWQVGISDGGGHGRYETIRFSDIRYLDLVNLDIKVNHAYTLDPNRWSVGGLAINALSSSSQGFPTNSQYGNYQIYIGDVGIWIYSTAFYRRDELYASGMYLGGTHRKDSMSVLFGIPTNNDWYHFTVENCVIHQTPHFGYYMYGTFDFHNNVCSTAARNDYYEWFDGPEGDPKQTATFRGTPGTAFPDGSYPNSGTWPQLASSGGIPYGSSGANGWHQMWTSDNSYAIVLSDGRETSGRSAGPGTKIYNNAIFRRSMYGANKWQGNRGMSIEGAIGLPNDPVEIFNNYIEVSQGKNGTFSTGTGWGTRLRWGGQWYKYYNNTIKVFVDSRPADGTPNNLVPSSVGNMMYGVRATFGDEHGGPVAQNVWIYDNTITTEYYNDPVLGVGGADAHDVGLAVDNIRTGPQDGRTIHIYGNKYNVIERALQMGGTGTDGACQNITVMADTVFRNAIYNTSGWKAIAGGWGGILDTGNKFVDLAFLNGASESQYSLGTGDNDSWLWGRTAKVLVVGNGTPPFVGVPQCSVSVSNNYGQLLANWTPVNSDAVWSDTVFYHTIHGSIDSSAYNDHVFQARKNGTTSAQVAARIDASGRTVIVTLPSVAGSVDTTGWQGADSVVTTNTPPTTPLPTSPTGGVTVSTSPTLVCNAANDPDNSVLAYTFEVSKFQNFSSIAASGQVGGGTSGQISWQVSPALQSATTFWWRVKATDFFESSAWSVGQSFQTDVAINSAPSTPQISSPPNGSQVAQASPTLRVVNSSDIDGDVLTYDFQLYDGDGTNLMSSASSVTEGAGGSTQWAVPLTIADGTALSWRARAYDGQLYSTWTPLSSFSISLGGNTGPSLPVHVTPIGGDTLVNSDITFTWQNSFDPEGDQVGYDLWITTDSTGGTEVDSARNIVESSGQQTSKTFINLASKLSSGATYWWRLRANDGAIWTSKTTPTPFVYYDLTLGNETGQAVASYPPSGALVRTAQPTLVATNITVAGANSYYFEVSTDSSFVTLAAASGAVPEGQGTQTAWTIDNRLEPNATYYWRVKANDNPYSLVSSFTVELRPHASPSPFVPAEDGFTTFHDLPEGSDLVIMTVDGTIVRRWNNVVGGTAVWDGSNGSGQAVSSGVYLWFITGSELKGKLIVQR